MKNLYKTTVTLPKPRYTTAVVVPEHLDYELERINQLDDTDFENYAEELRIHLLNLYEKEHFPIGTMGKTLQDIIVDLRKFNDYNTKDVLLTDKHGNENVLACFNKFSSAINNWFPEMYDTKIGSTKFSIIDQLRNKEMFRKNLNGIVRKDQFKFRINDPLAPISNYVASGFRVINGSQPAVNFPAGIAKWIYLNILSKKQFRDKKELKILDTSAGWGGRLVGLLSACNEELLHDKHITLLNTDPNSATHDRFQEIVDFWREYVAMELNFTLHKSILPSEDLLKFKYAKNNIGNFDMMLTSPPYYNREQYSNDKDHAIYKADSDGVPVQVLVSGLSPAKENKMKKSELREIIKKEVIMMLSEQKFRTSTSVIKDPFLKTVINLPRPDRSKKLRLEFEKMNKLGFGHDL